MQHIIDHTILAEQLATYATAGESMGLIVLPTSTLDVHSIVGIREAARRCDRVLTALLPEGAIGERERNMVTEAGTDILFQLPANNTPLAVAWPAERQDITALTQILLATLPLLWIIPLAHRSIILPAKQLEQTFPNLSTIWPCITPEHLLPSETLPLRQALMSAKKLRGRGERSINQLSRAMQGQLDIPTTIHYYNSQTGSIITNTAPQEALYVHISCEDTADGFLI